MGVHRALSRTEKYQAPREDPIHIINRNIHVMAEPQVRVVDSANLGKLYSGLRQMGCPSSVVRCVVGEVKAGHAAE